MFKSNFRKRVLSVTSRKKNCLEKGTKMAFSLKSKMNNENGEFFDNLFDVFASLNAAADAAKEVISQIEDFS